MSETVSRFLRRVSELYCSVGFKTLKGVNCHVSNIKNKHNNSECVVTVNAVAL